MALRILGWLIALVGLLCLVTAGVGYIVFGYDDAPSLVHAIGVAGIVGIAAFIGLDWKNLAAMGRDQTVARGAMAGVTILLIGAGAAIVNVMAYRYDTRWDLTQNKQFTLSEQSKSIAKAVDREVAVTAFFPTGSPAEQNFKQLIAGYTSETTLLKVEYHDPFANPLLAEQEKIISATGTVILRVGENQQRLETDFNEESITNALVKVTRDTAHSVCVVQGHGELDYMDDQTPGGIGVALQRLEAQNYKNSPLNLLDTQPTPETCEVVILPAPRGELLPTERDRLASYVAAGGGLFAMLDPLQTPELAADMARYGVKVGNDVVVEGDPNRMIVPQDPTALGMDSTSWDIHPVTQKLTGLVILSLARSVGKGDEIPGLNVQVVGKGSEQGWAETKLDDPSVPSEPNADVDIIGSAPLMVSVEVVDPANLRTVSEAVMSPEGAPITPAAATTAAALSAPATKAGGKVMVVGDGDFAANMLVLKVQNQDLFMNTVAWMVGEKDQLAIRANDAAKGKLELSVLSVFGAGVLSLLVIPGACVAGLIGTWLVRRGR